MKARLTQRILRLQDQPKVVAHCLGERVDHGPCRLPISQISSGIEEVDRVVSLARCRPPEFGMATPWDVGRVQAKLIGVPHLLTTRQRVDDVEGTAGCLDVLFSELLPHEPSQGSDPERLQPRDVPELVILIEEDRVRVVLAGPPRVLPPRNLEARGLCHRGLIPDVIARDESAAGESIASRPSKHEGLMSELVERGAHVP